MIKSLILNEGQLISLANNITELYDKDKVVTTGLEVIEIREYSDFTLVNFSYENRHNKLVSGAVTCTFHLEKNSITDFKELENEPS